MDIGLKWKGENSLTSKIFLKLYYKNAVPIQILIKINSNSHKNHNRFKILKCGQDISSLLWEGFGQTEEEPGNESRQETLSP